MKNARTLVFESLIKQNSQSGYSNLVLNNLLKKNNLSNQDKAFASVLFYGVIERQITLNYIIKRISKIDFEKIDLNVIVLLQIGLYQILYMNSVPDNAAVNETVNICKDLNMNKFSGFVNANLRTFLREEKDKINNYVFEDEISQISFKYSINKEIVELLLPMYDKEILLNFLEKSLNPSKVFIRINTLKTKIEKVEDLFKFNNIDYEKVDILNNCLKLKNASDINKIDGFSEGMFFVQDVSSQLTTEIINPQKGDEVIDACSAPGSKAFSLAMIMENSGKIFAFDLHEKRMNLIKEGAQKLNINIISTSVGNSSKNIIDYNEKADIVLCDVPCSGIGTINRKPEIKYKNISDISNLSQIQSKILSNCSRYVKMNGILIYSTCSINKNENEKIVDDFLLKNKNFILEPVPDKFKFLTDETNARITLLGDLIDSDGFFICKMKRIW